MLLNTLSEYTYFYISRNNTSYTFLLVFKIVESLQCILNLNKAHGHEKISIHMLKIFSDTICKPLELIFKQALTIGVLPSEWDKGNIVPC